MSQDLLSYCTNNIVFSIFQNSCINFKASTSILLINPNKIFLMQNAQQLNGIFNTQLACTSVN